MYKDDINKIVWGTIVLGLFLVFTHPDPGNSLPVISIALISMILMIVKGIMFANAEGKELSPLKEGWREFNVVDRVIWLEKTTKGYVREDLHGTNWRYKPEPKYQPELDYLKIKYKEELTNIDSVKTERIKEAKNQKKVSAKIHKEREFDMLYGKRNKHIVCPHCQSKGKVFKKKQDNIEESREKGIIGATIGRKTITKKGSYDQLYCDLCETTWEA